MKIMKNLFLLSTIILALNSCKPKPEPNPFDGNYITITDPTPFTIKDGKFSIDSATVCYISGNVDRAVFKAFERNTIYVLLKLENNILYSSVSYSTQQEAEAASPTFTAFANKV